MVTKESERLAAVEAATEQQFSLDGATVVREPRPVRVVYSARIPAELSPEIAALAAAAGVSPSAMIAQLVEEAIHARRLATSETVTVNRADLLRVIDRVLGGAAREGGGAVV